MDDDAGCYTSKSHAKRSSPRLSPNYLHGHQTTSVMRRETRAMTWKKAAGTTKKHTKDSTNAISHEFSSLMQRLVTEPIFQSVFSVTLKNLTYFGIFRKNLLGEHRKCLNIGVSRCKPHFICSCAIFYLFTHKRLRGQCIHNCLGN